MVFLWKKPIITRPGHADAKRPRTEVDVWRHSTHALEPLCRWHWKDPKVGGRTTKLAKYKAKNGAWKGAGLPFQVICWFCWMVRLWLTTIAIPIPWWFGVLCDTYGKVIVTTWHSFVLGMFSVSISATVPIIRVGSCPWRADFDPNDFGGPYIGWKITRCSHGHQHRYPHDISSTSP